MKFCRKQHRQYRFLQYWTSVINLLDFSIFRFPNFSFWRFQVYNHNPESKYFLYLCMCVCVCVRYQDECEWVWKCMYVSVHMCANMCNLHLPCTNQVFIHPLLVSVARCCRCSWKSCWINKKKINNCFITYIRNFQNRWFSLDIF